MKKNRSLKIWLTVALALGGIAFIASQSIGDVEYYVHVEQVIDAPQKWVGKKNLQVHGFVVPGSIVEEIRGQEAHRTFRIESKGRSLEVRHMGAKPDSFKDQAEAVVKGKLVIENGQPLFFALDGEPGIMAKCPSKYEGRK